VSALKANGPLSHIYVQREEVVYETCMENGVSLSRGSIFFTEELGWFRLTFTVLGKELEEGMKRLMAALSKVEQYDWKASNGSSK